MSILRGVAVRCLRWFARYQLSRVGRANALIAEGAVVDVRVRGAGSSNTIEVRSGAVLRRSTITLRGDGGRLVIEPGVRMVGGHLWLEGNDTRIHIGAGATFEPGVKIAAVEEGRAVVIGDGSMFSEDVEVRTSDSHPIFDADGSRLNDAASIRVGNRVWVANGALILKGTSVADDSVIGARSVVTHNVQEQGSVVAGAPAKVIRTGVTWAR